MKVVMQDGVVKLEQRANHRFRLTYGLQVQDDLDYAAAATELGCCLMHQLACDGKLDNEEVDHAD